MKKMIIVLLFLLPVATQAQTIESKDKASQKAEDKLPATKKPAPVEEGYEMKQYYFVMLTKGERRHEITDTTVIKKLQEGHMNNINRLAEQGKIILAGPFGDDGNWRGIFIFNVATKEEVEELLATDPAVAAGRLGYEIHPWWTAKNCIFK